MRGRPPKPTQQRKLEGNPGKRPLNLQEPTPPPATPAFDEPPDELKDDEIAKEEWRRVVPMMRNAKQITQAERGVLIALCREWSRYLEASQKVRLTGMLVQSPNGLAIQNPYLSIANAALKHCRGLWSELGLTPSSRSRVKKVEGGEGGDAFDEFDDPLTPHATH